MEEKFNPFYDSKFLISTELENPMDWRLLVELSEEELRQLQTEIEVVLKKIHCSDGLTMGA